MTEDEEKVRIERNIRMFEAVAHGFTYYEISKAENISVERVRQIIQKMIRMMVNPERLGADIVPLGARNGVKELRDHKEFWLLQLEKWKAEFIKK